jgi:peroxiredoxin family protein
MCSKITHSITIDAKITAHKILKDNSIKNISFFIKVKKVSGVYIYCCGLSQRRHY